MGILSAISVPACAPQSAKPSGAPPEIEAVEARTVAPLQEFKTEGTLAASREITLKSPIKGHIGDSFVAEPREVSANQVVLALDLDEVELALRAKQSELRATQAELESVQTDRDAIATRDEGADKDESLAARERALTLKLDQIQDEIDLLDHQLQKNTLVAPFDGLLTPAQDLYAAQPVSEGEELYRLVAVNPLNLKFLMPVNVAKNVGEGAVVTLTPYADPTQSGAGTVTTVSPYAQNRNMVEVVAQIDNGKHTLKIGQSGEVRLSGQSGPTTLFVPRKAVLNAHGVIGDPQVFVIRGDRALLTPVKLGQSRGDQVEITDGLRSGDRVAVSEIDTLANGEIVKIKRTR